MVFKDPRGHRLKNNDALCSSEVKKDPGPIIKANRHWLGARDNRDTKILWNAICYQVRTKFTHRVIMKCKTSSPHCNRDKNSLFMWPSWCAHSKDKIGGPHYSISSSSDLTHEEIWTDAYGQMKSSINANVPHSPDIEVFCFLFYRSDVQNLRWGGGGSSENFQLKAFHREPDVCTSIYKYSSYNRVTSNKYYLFFPHIVG